MSQSLRLRLLCGGVGTFPGFGVGLLFFVMTQPPRGRFPLFLPIGFSAAFAIVALLPPSGFPILLEIIVGFLIFGGAAWHCFAR